MDKSSRDSTRAEFSEVVNKSKPESLREWSRAHESRRGPTRVDELTRERSRARRERMTETKAHECIREWMRARESQRKHAQESTKVHRSR